jgi:hypothetical protein
MERLGIYGRLGEYKAGGVVGGVGETESLEISPSILARSWVESREHK